MGHLQRGVADLARLLLEDRADQLLLGGQLGLALGRDLAHQQVAGLDLGANAHDAAVVEVAQRLLGAVGDVASDLLLAELRRAGVDLVLLDVDRGELVVLHEALGEDDGVLEVVALPRHEGHHQVLAERHLAAVGGGAVGEHLAGLDLLAGVHAGLLVNQSALVGAHELLQLVLVVLALGGLHRDLVGVDELDGPCGARQQHVPGVERRATLHPGPDQGRVGLQQRHGLALHVGAHQRAVGVVVLEERDHRRGDRPDLLGGDVHEVDVLGPHRHVLPGLGAAEDLRALELASLGVDRGVGLGDQLLLLLGGVEVHDLLGHHAVLDHPVGRRDEAVLGDLREGGERADQADVRPLGGLDRAHAPVVGGVHVAHLDRGALAGQAARAERGETAAVGQARQRVGLVHELRELGGAEELLQRRHHGTDVDDRLGRDRVGVLGRQALTHDALHAVEADTERLLDQLADGAQAAVAEVLVLVEVVGDGLARHRERLGGVVLDFAFGVLGQAQTLRQRHELLDQREDVVVGEGAGVDVDVEPEARVELVAAHAREVVALGVEEQLVEQRLGVLHRRRLAGALLLEELDQRALFGARDLSVGVQRVADVQRVLEDPQDLLVGGVAHRAQQHRDGQLALAVDADVDLALLVDLELQPRTAGGHQVGDEDLLLAVLGLHQVGPGGAHELGDDDALGAVDDERPALGHPREVAHEHRLLADLARLAVDERHRDRQRARERQVLLATLFERGDGLVEGQLAELDGKVAGVVLDRRDVVDRLPQTALLRVGEPLEGAALDIDQVGYVAGLV